VIDLYSGTGATHISIIDVCGGACHSLVDGPAGLLLEAVVMTTLRIMVALAYILAGLGSPQGALLPGCAGVQTDQAGPEYGGSRRYR
jgi:hypothetical protein